MSSVLSYSFNAIAPILLLILVGYYCRRSGLLSLCAIKEINRFDFRFGLSCLMFVNIYEIGEFRDIPLDILAFTLGMLVLFTVIGFLIAGRITKQDNRKGVVIQACFRSNYAIIGIVLAQELAGQKGATLATLFQLPTVIYFNFVSVIVLSIYSETKEKIDFKGICKKLSKNPLIVGLIAGVAALVIRQFVPAGAEGELVFKLDRDLPWLYSAVKNLSRMATPLALVALGGQLELSDTKEFGRELRLSVLCRLVMAPVVGFSLALLLNAAGVFNLTPESCAMMVAAFGSPMAVSSVVMSAEMGADEVFAGQIVVWTSILSMLSLFIITGILRGFGYL